MSGADLATRAEAAILRGADFEPLTPEECKCFVAYRAFRWAIPRARPEFVTEATGEVRTARPEREAALVLLRGDVIALDLRPFKELPRVGAVARDSRMVPHRTYWDAIREEVIDLGPVTNPFPLDPSKARRVKR